MNQFTKIKIEGKIELLSGLHVGGSTAFAAIGAVDSPVIKDPVNNLPMIPGSSIKGKMRFLLAQAMNQKIAENPNQDDSKITRLFGASTGGGENGEQIIRGRLLFRDSFLTNKASLDELGIKTYTETKFENTINRRTAEASPRQIERSIRGSQFSFELIYELDNQEEAIEDFETILSGLQLLELDYLGGNGSRGYGKIGFKDITASTVFGGYDASSLNEQLKELL
ncbi:MULTISPECIES: type III-A CRISPR-associated RAMP protein Csm3 [Tetragenococcus]|uniref:CRISPR system Cms endoribonuclease Csm3 n=2 Tax=Tetragenococcus muriaticus TaxID=64642 RepID=A0A091C3Z0_9ENTE|nr:MULTISPECIES: type III-A CRISPR-associated RAMP protein Csm3 [Tetragenococcus]KFN92556.1 Csm3 family CRISPR-associated RAMP protein [Tetragenococcus muriaticus 3MR10-3]KFN93309.1 Csm3 family CRISPR-associated RAMP protein [Tetragenococcus muriaticus PMC-11-5]MCF1613627.1 type III-A CRISPR-associated RAMP protein Csm3 [Tetragenococcus koreensis]MCF1623377.1 type III-A CRISPR-associated RAMP protein Csm3 [Tetragenococcus koreensis]